jgi:hypothetical protein
MIAFSNPGSACRRHEVGLVAIVSSPRIGRINRPSGLWVRRLADAQCLRITPSLSLHGGQR